MLSSWNCTQRPVDDDIRDLLKPMFSGREVRVNVHSLTWIPQILEAAKDS